jgi:Ser/Thr protein kinase RdoA (MazF antagonist)
MYQKLVLDVLSQYGVDYINILSSQKGYRNEIYPIILSDSQMIQLTFFKTERGTLSRIKCSNAVSEKASLEGFPTRVLIDKRISRIHTPQKEIYAALYSYLPGNTIAWEMYTKQHLKLLGKTMSNLHAALSMQNFKHTINIVDENLELLERMNIYFNDINVLNAVKSKLSLDISFKFHSFKKILDGCRNLPNQTQLHMDFVRGNILFSDTTTDTMKNSNELSITGILDFEKTAYGHPLFDVARTLSFLYVDCKYKTLDQVKKYFIYSGYQKRGLSTLEHTGILLTHLVDFYLMYDLYKFLRHNPYESLNLNEHFKRTKDILIDHRMVHYI